MSRVEKIVRKMYLGLYLRPLFVTGRAAVETGSRLDFRIAHSMRHERYQRCVKVTTVGLSMSAICVPSHAYYGLRSITHTIHSWPTCGASF